MNYQDLLTALNSGDQQGDELFELVRSVAYFFQSVDSPANEALDLVIRLADRRELFEQRLSGVASMIDAVVREAGLFPYLQETGHWRDALALEFMRAPEMEDVFFHIEQAKAFKILAEGKSLILSAPTSFGKSLLIDALIASQSPRTVVATVPTIALLDEFRRRMEKRFPHYQIMTRSNDERTSDHAIYIGTQERLLERHISEKIDLFVIDEFYKLDLEKSDSRSIALNAVLSRYGKSSKQIYLLGPSIDGVPNVHQFRPDITFVRTHYSPVTANIIDRSSYGPSPELLMSDLKDRAGESSLIYVRSPASASKLAFELCKAEIHERSSFLGDLGHWLGENIHPEWVLAKSVSSNVGIHHGRVPRAIAHLMITLFNKDKLKSLICTSSMIEGVNTSAQNVFIYDRHISIKKLDRFTFDNIKGRAGRLFRHKIGNVYLYSLPPSEDSYQVNIPLLTSGDNLQPELLFQVDDGDLTQRSRARKRSISEASLLPESILATWSTLGVDELNIVAAKVQDELNQSNSLLRWNNEFPTYKELSFTLRIAWNDLLFSKHDVRSPEQCSFYSFRWAYSKNIREFMDSLVKNKDISAQIEIDRAFNFLRGAEYSFPQVLRALADIIDYLEPNSGIDYRVYAAQLQNLFLPGDLRALDEFGIPLPIVFKLSDSLPSDAVDARRLLEEAGGAFASLSELEKDVLKLGLQ